MSCSYLLQVFPLSAVHIPFLLLFHSLSSPLSCLSRLCLGLVGTPSWVTVPAQDPFSWGPHWLSFSTLSASPPQNVVHQLLNTIPVLAYPHGPLSRVNIIFFPLYHFLKQCSYYVVDHTTPKIISVLRCRKLEKCNFLVIEFLIF